MAMRVRSWRSTHRTGGATAVRLCSTEMLKLFGREASPAVSASNPAAVNRRLRRTAPEETRRAHASQELHRFGVEAYVTADRVSRATQLRTLTAIQGTLQAQATRFTVENSSLWKESLRVLNSPSVDEGAAWHPQSDGQSGSAAPSCSSSVRGSASSASAAPVSAAAAAASECCFALLLSGRRHDVKEVAARVALLSGVPVPDVRPLGAWHEFCALLRVASCYVLSCCLAADSGEQGAPRFDERSVTPILSLLASSRRIANPLDAKEHRREVVRCVELLLMSLDWLFHDLQEVFVHPLGEDTAHRAKREVPHALVDNLFTPAKALAPRWLRDSLFVACASTREEGGGCPPPTGSPLLPSSLRVCAQHAARRHDLPALEQLYALARGKEESNADWHAFDLATSIGEALLNCPGGYRSPRAPGIVQSLGTSLSPETLSAVALHSQKEGASEAVRWLAQTQGARAYAALRTALFHQPPEALAAIQEEYGDVLTGERHANWLSALEAVEVLQHTGQSLQWRRQLPTTLRLLSDAGKFKAFFRLVREYDVRFEKGSGNLCVASALAQAMRRTGRWPFHQEVLDLVANAPVPSSAAEDVFLGDAALQTLYALRNAKRWEEAAAFFGLLRPAMDTSALRVFASVVSDAAASCLQSDAETPTAAATTEALLAAARVTMEELPRDMAKVISLYTSGAKALDSVDLASVEAPARRHVQRVCTRAGRWRPLVLYARRLSRPSAGRDNAREEAAESETEAVWRSVLHAVGRCRWEDVRGGGVSWELLDEWVPLVFWSDERCLLQLFHAALWNGWLRGFQKTVAEKDGSLAGTETDGSDGGGAALRRELGALTAFLLGSKGAPTAGRVATAERRPPSQSSSSSLSLSSVSSGLLRKPVKAVRHPLVGHYYTSFVTREAFKVFVDEGVSCGRQARGAVARHFRVPPLCVGVSTARRSDRATAESEIASGRCFLRPYPKASNVDSTDIRFATPDGAVVVGYKPVGAVLQSVARGVLSRLGDRGGSSGYQIAYLLPPGSGGLFVLVSAAANPKRFVFDLVVSVALLPLSTHAVALLSCKFFRSYRMTVAEVPSEEEPGNRGNGGGAAVRVQFVCGGLNVLGANGALRSLKAAANEEGWTFVEPDVGAREEALCVRSLSLCDFSTGDRAWVV